MLAWRYAPTTVGPCSWHLVPEEFVQPEKQSNLLQLPKGVFREDSRGSIKHPGL